MIYSYFFSIIPVWVPPRVRWVGIDRWYNGSKHQCQGKIENKCFYFYIFFSKRSYCHTHPALLLHLNFLSILFMIYTLMKCTYSIYILFYFFKYRFDEIEILHRDIEIDFDYKRIFVSQLYFIYVYLTKYRCFRKHSEFLSPLYLCNFVVCYTLVQGM